MSDQLHEVQQNIANFELQRWLNDGLFTWTWWFLLGVLVIPWMILFFLIDRNNSSTIWFYGLLVLIITSFTDDLGAELGIWVYPIELVPYSIIQFPFDFSIVPVTQMLLFQFFKSWKTFNIALILKALIFAFIGDPFAIWAGAVSYYGWTYYYSFIFYVITGNVARAFVKYWAKTN